VTFIQFLGLVLFINASFLLLAIGSLRACIRSNNGLRDRLREAGSRENELRVKVKTYEELQARVPSVEPAWGSDPSGEPSRLSVALAEERKILEVLRQERDQMEAAMRMPGPLFEIGPAQFFMDGEEHFPSEMKIRGTREVKTGFPAVSFANAERMAHSYYEGNFDRKWLRHTLRCTDVRDDEIHYLGSAVTFRTLRVYMFSAIVVEK
jgi:hypothetical protein